MADEISEGNEAVTGVVSFPSFGLLVGGMMVDAVKRCRNTETNKP